MLSLSLSVNHLKNKKIYKAYYLNIDLQRNNYNIIFCAYLLIMVLVSLRHLTSIYCSDNNQMKLLRIIRYMMIIEFIILLIMIMICWKENRILRIFNKFVGINSSITCFCLCFYHILSIKITHNKSYTFIPLIANMLIQLLLVYGGVLEFKHILYIGIGMNCFIANFIVPILIQAKSFSNVIYLFYCFLWIILLLSYNIEQRNKRLFKFSYLLKKSNEREKRILSFKSTGILIIKDELIASINNVMYNIIINQKEMMSLVKINMIYDLTPSNIIEILNENINNVLYDLLGKDLKIKSNHHNKINSNKDKTSIWLLNCFKTQYHLKQTMNHNYTLEKIEYHLKEDEDYHLSQSYKIMYKYSHKENLFTFVFHQSHNKIKHNPLTVLNNDKSIFLSKIAYEFKQTLISISEIVDIIGKNNTSILLSQSQTINFNLIKSFTLYLYTLAKDMECHYNFQQNKEIQLCLTSVNITDIIDFTKQIANGLIARQGLIIPLTFDVIIDKVVPKIIFTDQMRLKQILINLISNSIKFTDKGKILLHLSEEDDALKFSVIDTGRGLNHDQQKVIFLPFEKSTNEKNINGAGLGLCIVRELSLAIGQEIQFTSLLNSGSTFWFKIPLMNNKGDMISNKEEYEIERSVLQLNDVKTCNSTKNTTPSIINRHYEEEFDFCSEETLVAPLQTLCFDYYNKEVEVVEEVELKLEQKMIVLADDEEIIRQSTIITINDYAKKYHMFIEIFEAINGYEVLNFICKNPTKKIDLILCDDNMEYCHGKECYTVLSKLYNDHKIDKIPFVLLTTQNQTQNQGIGLNQNYSKLQTHLKPLDESTLHILINQIST